MSTRDVITFAELSTFEDEFQKALEASQRVQSKHTGGHVYEQATPDGHTYEFWTSADVRQGLPKKLYISGPTFSRGGKQTGFGSLGYVDLEKGKLEAWGDKKQREMTEYAVERFLHAKGKVFLDSLPYRLNYRQGYVFLTKRKPGTIYYKEIALIALQMPGRKLTYFTPDGKKKIEGYDAVRKLKIPSAITTAIDEHFIASGEMADLERNRNILKRPSLNAWEDRELL